MCEHIGGAGSGSMSSLVGNAYFFATKKNDEKTRIYRPRNAESLNSLTLLLSS
jgi:hypothetical protein